MKAILDTSSLLAFVRYYLPFDKSENLKELIKTKFDNGEIILLDKVVEESKYISKGIILNKLEFIKVESELPKSKSKIVDTSSLVPYPKFFNLLENQFCNKEVLRLKELTDVEFENAKKEYLAGADSNLLLYSLKIKSENPLIVTEETINQNDNKIFRKIPDCCNYISIQCCSLPILLQNHFGVIFEGK